MKVSNQIIEVLEYLCQKFGIVIDWTSESILPYLEQLCEKFVNYEIKTSITWIIFSIVISIISFIISLISEDWFLFTIVIIASTIIIGCQTLDIIECTTFPEKAVFEYIKSVYDNF